ncbi:MAG: TetR/AcrR family transcriptional regulator [Pseudomonadales bacterium]
MTAMLSKGQRTAQRILDAAEVLFAERGYNGATLREVAQVVGIREPGLYRHFASKELLYRSVLDRGLRPIADVLDELIAANPSSQQLGQLPAAMIDLLAEHPHLAALFQQALQNHETSLGDKLLDEWLHRLLANGKRLMAAAGLNELDDTEVTLRVINLFNVCTAYFTANTLITRLSGADALSDHVLERQKKLVTQIIHGWMIG